MLEFYKFLATIFPITVVILFLPLIFHKLNRNLKEIAFSRPSAIETSKKIKQKNQQEKYTFLKDGEFFLIGNIWEIIKKSYQRLIKLKLSNSDKKEVNALMTKAKNLMSDFERLYKVGMADKYKKIEQDGNTIYIGYKDTMLDNLKLIRTRLDELLLIQAEEISSSIFDFSINDEAVLNEVETKFEGLVNYGERIISLIDNNKLTISTENEFTIRKIVNERLPELHKDYLNSVKDKEEIEEQTSLFENILDDLESLFSDYEKGLKQSISDSALQNLLIQQRYFKKRANS